MLKENLGKIKNEEIGYAKVKVKEEESLLKIAICEYEKEHIEELEKVLGNVKGNKNIQVETFLSSSLFLNTLEKREELPDIIFLDIEMPEIDGITIGKKLQKISSDSYIIFTTAHPEYAVKGYEARAFRYILKPFSEEVISKVLFDVSQELGKNKKLMLQSDGKEHIIPLKDIIYICAEDKYTILYTKQQHYIERISLNSYEKLLSSYGFYRIHRKYIVNFFHHKGIENGRVHLTNNVRISISRRKEKEYHKELLQHLEKELI